MFVLVGALVAFANGANDNFKGVATLFGSGTTSYKRALFWATLTTALGSLTALVVAQGLLAAFSGKGLVPAEVVADPAFTASVALATGVTVLLATRLGFPISTTHALIGSLVGAGMLASATGINTAKLTSGFVLPLLLSPVLSITLAALLYPPLRFLRRRLGVTSETCVCVGEEVVRVVPESPSPTHAMQVIELATASAGTEASCRTRYGGRILGLNARSTLDSAHFLSAGALSFARGLNDTPKIAALLLVGNLLSPTHAIIGVAIAMAIGGIVSARRVAETMSHKVTDLNAGQGLTANVVTATLVIFASRWGVPVSTTHVSCGALFGIGTVTRGAHWRTVGSILLAWVVTLPIAGALAAMFTVLLGPLL